MDVTWGLNLSDSFVGRTKRTFGQSIAEPSESQKPLTLVNLLASEKSGKLRKGDAAILGFLADAEILETDFWQQYNELGGIQDSEVSGGSGSPPYVDALVTRGQRVSCLEGSGYGEPG
jgi:hypothetical protein